LFERQFAARQTRHVQQIVDETDDMGQLTSDNLARCGLSCAAGLSDLQNMDGVLDRRQRVPQLVREHRQEFVLPPAFFEQLTLGHLPIVNVDVGPHTLQDATIVARDRHTAAQEPAVGAVAAP
jgi:hypothetical protein